MANSIFDFESRARVQSPEQLKKYIRVATPGIKVMIFAMFLVLAAFILWGITGRIPKVATFKCGVDPMPGHHIYALVDPAKYDVEKFVGKEVEFKRPSGISGRGKAIDGTTPPLSREEIAQILKSDFLTNALVTADYSNVLEVEPEDDLSLNRLEIGEVTIIVDEVPPISFLIN